MTIRKYSLKKKKSYCTIPILNAYLFTFLVIGTDKKKKKVDNILIFLDSKPRPRLSSSCWKSVHQSKYSGLISDVIW